MPSFYYLIFIHRYLCTHARPACPICWTTLAVRSLAEQSAAVRSKLFCKTNLIWRGLINKWDYVLKKTRLYTLNQIWSCFRNLWMFLLYLIWGLAVFSSLRPSFTVNLTECGPFRNPYRASLLDTPFSSTSLKCIKHLAPLTLDQLQQMCSWECFIGFTWISRPMKVIFTVGQNSKLATKRSTVNTFT